MDLLDDPFLLVGIFFILIIDDEQVVKVLWWLEQMRHQEVQERPEFFQIILKWGSCQKNSVFSFELSQILRKHTLIIFDSLGFVENEILVMKFGQLCFLSHDGLESGKDHIELPWSQLFFLSSSFFTGSVKLEQS